jgi:outer membrane immunogenic protein
MSKYRRIVAVVAAAMTSVAAAAADLPTFKAPPPAPPMVGGFSWTGAYFGAVAGYGWADSRGEFSIASASLAAAPPIIPVLNAAGSQAISTRGGMFGGELGYNWQISNFAVLGLEGDIEGGHVSGSHVIGGTVPNFGIPFTIGQSLSADWRASARARAGFAPMERMLLYVTGGPALAQIRYSSAYWDPVPEVENASFSSVRPGFAVGGGVEYAIGAGWSLKGEYLYSKFSAAMGGGTSLLADGTTASVSHSTGTFQESAARVGLNYHF